MAREKPGPRKGVPPKGRPADQRPPAGRRRRSPSRSKASSPPSTTWASGLRRGAGRRRPADVGQLGRHRRGRGRRRRGKPNRRCPPSIRIRPHHRPGAHVHARDGLGRLLTREGEIEIAKRIEDGLKHMIRRSPKARPRGRNRAMKARRSPSRQDRARRDAHRPGSRPDRPERGRGSRLEAEARNWAIDEEARDEDGGRGRRRGARTLRMPGTELPTCTGKRGRSSSRRQEKLPSSALVEKGSADKTYLAAAADLDEASTSASPRAIERLCDSVRHGERTPCRERKIQDLRGQWHAASSPVSSGLPRQRNDPTGSMPKSPPARSSPTG